jgi:hypothetical protein
MESTIPTIRPRQIFKIVEDKYPVKTFNCVSPCITAHPANHKI